MYLTPEDHAANPPSSWQVTKAGPRLWRVVDNNGDVITTCPTRREAEEEKTSGSYVKLYEKQGRWFRGEHVPGWRPYKPNA